MVCDYVNRCVKQYDSSGNFIEIVARDIEANHLAVSRRGVVYVRLDDGHIAVFHQGKRTRGIRVGSHVPLIEGYEQGIALVDDDSVPSGEGWLAVSDPAQSQYLVAQVEPEAGALLSVAADKMKVMPGKPQPDGIRYRPRWKERQQGLLQRFTSDGMELAPILISTNDTLGSIAFKGKDTEGNLYIENERITPDQYVHLEIRVYSPQGELLRTFELPNNYYTTVYRKTWLRPDGTILQMLTQPDSVSFTYWN